MLIQRSFSDHGFWEKSRDGKVFATRPTKLPLTYQGCRGSFSLLRCSHVPASGMAEL